MRPGHARAAPATGITVDRHAGTDVDPGSGDVGFEPVAAIHRDRAAAAETGDVVAAVRGANGERSVVNGWRCNRAATGAFIAGGDDDDHAGGTKILDGSLKDEEVGGAFRGVRVPGIIDDIGGLGWVGILVIEIRRCEKPLKTFQISGGRSPTAFHVAAAYPFGSGRHADLVARAIVADHGAHGMRAVGIIIARRGQIIAAGIVAGVVGIGAVDGVVPVVIMIGVGAVPPPVVIFQGRDDPIGSRCPVRPPRRPGRCNPAPTRWAHGLGKCSTPSNSPR